MYLSHHGPKQNNTGPGHTLRKIALNHGHSSINVDAFGECEEGPYRAQNSMEKRKHFPLLNHDY